MNILFLTQRVPYPPNKGDKLRAFYEIKFLSKRHSIDLLCLADDERDLLHKEALLRFCQSVDIVPHSVLSANVRAILGLASSKPLTQPFFYNPQLQAFVRRKLAQQRYDLIFVYCSSMAQYVERVDTIPKVIDFVDVDSEKWAQYAQVASFPKNLVYRLESQRLRKYEQRLASTFQHGFLVSQQEVDDFQRVVCPCDLLTALSNGVDLERFTPSSEPYNPSSLIFTGAMDYFANVETALYFAREIFPCIQQEIPEAAFSIVGSKPAEELRRLAEQNPHIIVTGFVEQVQPYFQKAAVFVAPMRIARGIQNKILEAMAMGVPVVTTSLGFEGIPATPGEDILVEDQPEQFARQVIRLMTEPAAREMVAARARKVIETAFDWDTNLARLEHILERCVEQFRAR